MTRVRLEPTWRPPALLHRLLLASCVVAGLAPSAAAWAQLGPTGPGVQVNVVADGDQTEAVVAAADREALVVWSDRGLRLAARRLVEGVPVGGEIEVASAPDGGMVEGPEAVALPGGGWLVAWVRASYGQPSGILLRRLGADGEPAGAATAAATLPGGRPLALKLAVDGEGRSALLWHTPGSGGRLAARFFDTSGDPVGGMPSFGEDPGEPAVTATAAGFLVAWTEPAAPGRRLVARLFDHLGNSPDPPRPLFVDRTAEAFGPVLAGGPGGGAVAAWIARRGSSAGPGEPADHAVLVRPLGPRGAPAGDPVRLDVDRTRIKTELRLAAIPGAGLVASWSGPAGGPSGQVGYGIVGRFLTPEAAPAGPERILFEDERSAVFGHRLAGSSDGSLTEAWTSCHPRGFVGLTADLCAGGDDGSGLGVFARRFETVAAGSLVLVPGPETLGEAGVAALVTVERLGGAAGTVTVEIGTEELEGGATAGLDYEERFETLVWADGDRSPRTLTVPLLADSRFEGDEAFLVELGNPTGGAALGEPAAVRFTIVDDEGDFLSGIQVPFTVEVGSASACDFERLAELHRRLRAETPGTGKPSGINLSLTASGDFSGLAYTGNGPGTAEHHLAFSTNPEATTLLRNPARPQLPTVGFTRNRLASDLVTPGAPDVLNLVLDPTLESNRGPDPAAFLRIDNLERGAGGRPADAKPGRGLLPLAEPCHGRLGVGDARVLQVLQRVVRAETPGAERQEISIHPGPVRNRYHVVVQPFGGDGGSLGAVTAEIDVGFVIPVNPAEDPALLDALVRVPPACPPIDPPIGGTICHTLMVETTLHLIRPAASGELWEPGPYRIPAVPEGGGSTIEVSFRDLLPSAWRQVSQF